MKGKCLAATFYILVSALGLIGVWGSLEIALRRPLDPDMFHSILVWEGVREHGLAWLKEWRFTQDNWLFSLMPAQIFFASLFVNPSDAIVLSGWLIFFLAAIISGAIAKQLGGKRTPIVVVVLLLLSNAYAHWEGNAAYPVSHNITNLLGLLSVWLILKWLSRPNWWLAGIVGVVQIIAGLSDPWLLPTYTLPSLIALALVGVKSNRNHSLKPKLLLFLLGLIGLVLLVVKTRFFGAFSLMPVMHFSLGDYSTILNNAYYLVRNIGGLFALVYPVWDAHLYWPETNISYAVFSFLAILILFSYAFYRVLWASNQKGDWVFFFTFAGLSIGGICAAYVISSVRANLAARFEINVLYLVVISLPVFFEAAWSKIGPKIKLFAATVGFLYCIGSATSLLNFILNSGWPANDKTANELIDVLKKNGLDYGYGPYHGAKSGVVTALTEAKIKIRPVSFNNETGRIAFTHPQTHPLWYTDSDYSDTQQKFFFYLPRDTPECPNYEGCRENLVRDFGPPSKVIPFNEGEIFVWNHALLSWGNSKPIKVSLGNPINFNNQQFTPLWTGWASPEPWGMWSISARAYTYFEFNQPITEGLNVRLLCQAYPPYLGINQWVDVLANGKKVAELDFTSGSNRKSREFLISEDEIYKGRLVLEFVIRDPFSPKDKGVSSDDRKLGMGISEVVFSINK